MPPDTARSERIVPAVHGRRELSADPTFELGLVGALADAYGRPGLIELYARFALGDGMVDGMMRRVIWRALARRCGDGLSVGGGVVFRHLETFEIGADVHIGAQATIQGRFDGTCAIGDNTWIGPHAFLDARDLYIGNFVGWGPGAKALGSTHVGLPASVPVIRTDLRIRPIRIEDWADIGVNATILPGVTVGKGAIVGAGAVVVTDVPPFAVVAGVPARFLHWRTDSDSMRRSQELEVSSR
jgi:acetyltransferase-like isoleucine patch superfamily enzyme